MFFSLSPLCGWAQSENNFIDPQTPEAKGSQYIATWPDLMYAFGPTPSSGLDHFATYGINEGRNAQLFFDATEYLNNYPNVQSYCSAFLDKIACAASHFISIGFSAGQGWTDLHALLYIASYPDLQSAFGIDTEAAKQHSVTNGRSERRRITFNVVSWLAANPDSATKVNFDFEAATRYYIRNGSTAWTDVQPFRIFSNNYCLGVQGGIMAAGSKIVSASCNGLDRQLWMFRADGSIASKANPSLCMLPSNTTSGDSFLIVDSCSNSSSQQWDATNVKGIASTVSGLCMDTSDRTLTANKEIYLHECDYSFRSQWWYPRK